MTFYGIRHHGPGCARSLQKALQADPPDLILLESPAETESLLASAAQEGMKPPVAMLLYQSDGPENAAFYPFARFSPEWQAILWALKNEVPIRCFDLPAAHSLAEEEQEDEAKDDHSEEEEEEETPPTSEYQDPFTWIAKADGYDDGERWWNDKVEERDSSQDFFQAINEAVVALREELALPESDRTLRREAWMRRCMRQAEKDGFQNIAVICGAWHVPALLNKPKVSEDNARLKGLPKVKVAATWTPWTLDRLTTHSGYGAGVRAPGWYDHVWAKPKHPHTTWLTKAARILRKNDLEGSSASIIEATRLSESLAGMRGRPRPGLDESMEAIQTVFCQGDAAPLSLLSQPLLIGKALGTLPEGLSQLPLQKDIEATQKRLRLKPTAGVKEQTLDLREESGRKKSAFLHRLRALKINWGEPRDTRSKGTFKELWILQWKPELLLAIIDASPYGNTLEVAAGNALVKTEPDQSLDDITSKLDHSLLAVLPQATEILLTQLDAAAATSHNTRELLTAIPALVRIARYGDVRKTDTSKVTLILKHLTTRLHIELAASASGLDDEAGREFADLLRNYSAALLTLDKEELLEGFYQAANRLSLLESAQAEVRGVATRLLRDANRIESEEAARRLSFALSRGTDPLPAANWLQGFLAGSGSLLVHDRPLLALIHDWLSTLNDENFQESLPLLRRTFGSFTSPERSKIAQTLKSGDLTTSGPQVSQKKWDVNAEQAAPALQTVCELLELPAPSSSTPIPSEQVR
ncbi:DUF5682 family protein [Roseibacillus persicicus]|uniref:Uncharacterized protein n=1 Tax=Roseibacillus persicicus TaxID=454148 RepID=A0A918TV25_9BACT|nr:DUF5682 family protein [Roseibacillus persicicus]GHC64046.1 hypothetical protein GCM10007100_34580 [Roseibacillus persicicus]